MAQRDAAVRAIMPSVYAMMPPHFAALLNLTGFLAGAGLYAMLLELAARGRRRDGTELPELGPASRVAPQGFDPLTVVTALLGLLWSVGALVTYKAETLGFGPGPGWLAAAALGALGGLPAAVFHSVLRPERPGPARFARTLVVGTAWTVSLVGAVACAAAPSPLVLQVQAIAFLVLVVPMAWLTRAQGVRRRALWLTALAVFALSAFHLGAHEDFARSVLPELLEHHPSIPLGLAILYQDYPFALGDVFLKRALAFVGVLALAFVLLTLVVTPLVTAAGPVTLRDAGAVLSIVAMSVVVAVSYPFIRRGVDRFVDSVVLKRTSPRTLHADVARIAMSHDAVGPMLDEACRALGPALARRDVGWALAEPPPDGTRDDTFGRARRAAARRALAGWEGDPSQGLVVAGEDAVVAIVPTSDSPRPALVVLHERGAQRLLSDDLVLLERVAVTLGRRIDAIRIAAERVERRFREQEEHRLAVDAELRALRAQLNPHFLFNALTTIGHLIRSSPQPAFETLMRLTDLLRRVLRSEGHFSTLGAEVDLASLYLDIERARFEDRLRVEVDVPDALRDVTVPALIVQPLVENAVKHGIAPLRFGGTVTIRARRHDEGDGTARLVLSVDDTGAGSTGEALERGRQAGVGLRNLERRLKLVGGDDARLDVTSSAGRGTCVTITVPLTDAPAATSPGDGVGAATRTSG